MAETATEKIKLQSQDQNLSVALRIRPMNDDEVLHGATPVAHSVQGNMVVLLDPADDPDDVLRANRSREKNYAFDHAMSGEASQKDVYEKTCKVLIPSVIGGYNATVFAYGATGAGKTYTMLGTDNEPGIMARALNDLFLEMERTREDMAYRVTMSYLEIYNEMIRDLLNPTSGFLDLREDAKGVQVAGLSEVSAKSTHHVMGILSQGNQERTQEPTAANQTSSRSHAVLMINVKQRHRTRDIQQQVRLGRLFLIDLAGSERAANTQNRGKRMVEGAHINRSLLALGNCINALSDKNGPRYVNYRDSKLTRLLKDALGGNCKTVMIAHVSPASIHFEESRNTLVYADRAKNIKTKVRKNVLDVSYHIAQYTSIISDLKEEINRLHKKLDHRDPKSAINVLKDELQSGGQQELIQLKKKLLQVFNSQMDYRHHLMELNNTSMEVDLEMSRNELMIKKWERDKGHSLLRKDGDTDPDRVSTVDEVVVPDEVRMAREEMEHLVMEKERTERLKIDLQRKLDDTKNRASVIVEHLPQHITSDEQQEILSLLCKVHEVEIDNMQMQSSVLLTSFEVRKRDLALDQSEQHRSLCDEIISQQRALIDDHQLECSRELEELYEMYQQEKGLPFNKNFILPDINLHRTKHLAAGRQQTDIETKSGEVRRENTTHSAAAAAANLPPLLIPSSLPRREVLKKSAQPLHKNETTENSLFSHSPIAKEIRAAEAKAKVGAKPTQSMSSLDQHSPERARQKSILTLSSRSTTSSPVNTGVDSNKLVVEKPKDRQMIAFNTRNIAALAAKRKNKAHINAINSEKLDANHDINSGHVYSSTSTGQYPMRAMNTDAESYLTQSRLAQHNKKFGSSLTLNNQTGPDDSTSMSTDPPLFFTEVPPPEKRNRPLYRNPAPLATPQSQQHNQPRASRKNKKHRKQQPNYNQQWKPQYLKVDNYIPRHLAKISPRKAAEMQTSMSSLQSGQSRIPTYSQSRGPRTSKMPFPDVSLGVDLTPIDPAVKTNRSDKSDKVVKAPVLAPKKKSPTQQSTDSSSSTPKEGGTSNKKKSKAADKGQQGTIPSYRTADFGITGQGIHR